MFVAHATKKFSCICVSLKLLASGNAVSQLYFQERAVPAISLTLRRSPSNSVTHTHTDTFTYEHAHSGKRETTTEKRFCAHAQKFSPYRD